ncbi:hypothetical protein GGR52DRAFT_457478 [Hypoxylon sp. FL1284]|nr:hypothetical protein GGR52DRAFT_457478 [Hypoxylon sp. FL1284]
MSVLIKTIVILAALASSTLAAPTPAPTTECRESEHFYSCGNGYKGCFAQDPCSLPAISTSCSSSSSAGDTQSTLRQPSMYNVYPGQPFRESGAAGTHLDVTTAAGDVPQQQVAAFRGLPAGARDCTLGWVQADELERDFVVTDNGATTTVQMTGFPPRNESVTAGNLTPYYHVPAVPNTVDFTNWDQTPGAATHIGMPISCAEDVYVRLAIDNTNGLGRVSMGQDAMNGLTLTYTC